MTLGQKIKLLRKSKDMTQSDLADTLYVSRQAVQKWESDVSVPDVDKLPDMAKLFGVTVDCLLDKETFEQELLKNMVKTEEEKAENKSPLFHPKSMLDYLIAGPVWVGLGILIFMAYAFGGMLVLMLFGGALGGLVYGLFSVVNVFLNASLGIGAILIAISFFLLGTGLCYPLFTLGRLWLKKYMQIVKKLTDTVRKLLKGDR